MSAQAWQRPLAAVPLEDGGVEFRVWAPAASRVAVRVGDADHELAPVGGGVFAAEAPAQPGDDYLYVLDGSDALPDPCSRWQPNGITAPSRVVDTARFEIVEGPRLLLEELVLYELHVGTFTPEGTFDGAITRLEERGWIRALTSSDRRRPYRLTPDGRPSS